MLTLLFLACYNYIGLSHASSQAIFRFKKLGSCQICPFNMFKFSGDNNNCNDDDDDEIIWMVRPLQIQEGC